MFKKMFVPNAVILGILLVILAFMLLASGEEFAQALKFVGVMAVLGFGLQMVWNWNIAKGVSLSLDELSMGAQRLGLGEDRQKILSDEEGALGNLVKAFNRMSERLTIRIRQLEEDRQQMRTILSGMIEGVVALDSNQRILYANDRAMSLLGLTSNSFEGKRLWELVRNRELMDLVSESLIQPEARKKELAWSYGVTKNVTIHAARLPGIPVRGAVLVMHDTSELRRLERLRQDFVANVSHELKTPLAVIKVCAETLVDGALDDPNNRMRFLNQILEQSERLHTLIMDLLSLARIEAEKEMFEMGQVPVEEVVNQCVKRHQDRALAKGQTLIGLPMSGALKPKADLSVWMDEEAFIQVVDNLVDNAVRYTPGGGKIEVTWGREGRQAVIEVRDNGYGIPPADLPRVFERFYRVDKARSREVGGTGLGLSIVKHLVQAMDGTIGATSEVGKGSVFTIRLPLADHINPA